jgi:hypothetical protein
MQRIKALKRKPTPATSWYIPAALHWPRCSRSNGGKSPLSPPGQRAFSAPSIGCGTLAPRSRRGTATHTARDSNPDSGNHDMSRLSTLAYPNDAPIHYVRLRSELTYLLVNPEHDRRGALPRHHTYPGANDGRCVKPQPQRLDTPLYPGAK